MAKEKYDSAVLAEYTRVKIQIVVLSFDCSEDLQAYIKLQSPHNELELKSGIIKLYSVAKPHILKANKLTEEQKEEIENVLNPFLIGQKPLEDLKAIEAMGALDKINIAIEKAGITKISYRAPKAENTFKHY